MWKKRQGTSIDGKSWVVSTTADEVSLNMFAEIHSESDRVAVIVALARLEELLRELMKAFLVDDHETKERVLNPLEQGILSTFSGLVDIAFLSGLLSKDVKQALKSMARLRNHFAHNPNYRMFDDLILRLPKAKKRQNDLKYFQDKAAEILASDDTDPNSPGAIRGTFLALFHMLEFELKVAIQYASQNQRQELLHPHVVSNIKY
jgi:hypothetical protein